VINSNALRHVQGEKLDTCEMFEVTFKSKPIDGERVLLLSKIVRMGDMLFCDVQV